MKRTFEKTIQNPNYEGVEDVTPEEVKAQSSHIVLIDVRENDEYVGELGHIEGATLTPLGELSSHLEALPKDKTIVFICRSGNRSGKASLIAKEFGLTDVYNMLGGMILWNDKGFNTTVEL